MGVSVAPPTGAGTTISLDPGGTSGGYLMTAAGPYAVMWTPGGDSVVGRMTITVTN